MSFLTALSSKFPEKENIKNLTENMNDVVAGVDVENMVMLFHSITN